MESRERPQKPAGQVCDIITAQLERVAVHRSKFPLPTGEDALQGTLGIHEFLLDFRSYLIGKGDIPEHFLVGAKNIPDGRFEVLFNAISRQAQVAENFFNGALEAHVLSINLFQFA